MKPKPLREWLKIYEEKTNDKAELLNGFQLFYLPTRGFMMIKALPNGSILYIDKVCGDGKFWRDHAELMAHSLRFDHILTVCNREIRSYIRDFGGEILLEQNINGEKRFLCQDNIGRKVLATFRGKDKNGNDEYYVTQYINEKATYNLDFIEGSKDDV